MEDRRELVPCQDTFSSILKALVKNQGLQSHRASDLRQQMSLALERQLNGQLVNQFATASLINIPVANQGSATVPCLNALSNFQVQKSFTKTHPPLTASNSVANCNAASHHIKSLASKEHRKLDRSISEPVDRSQQSQRQVQPNSSRYKTELCRPFEENGTCKYGDKCQFAHGIGELRTLTRHPKYKTELCRTFHSTGFCPYGPRCHFIHNSEDSKKCLLNTLQTNCSIPENIHASNPTPAKLSVAHPAPKDYDICGFSLGSAGDLSPTSSTSSSSGSPTSSLNSFFHDDSISNFVMSNVPHTAPPTITNGFFFGSDCTSLKTLSPIPALIPQQPAFFPQQRCTTDDSLVSTIDMLVNDMENLNCQGTASKLSSPNKLDAETELDINRNVIRLPIFSSLAHGDLI